MNPLLMEPNKAAEANEAIRTFLANGDPDIANEVLFTEYADVRRFVEPERRLLLAIYGVVRILRNPAGNFFLIMRKQEGGNVVVQHWISPGIEFSDSSEVLSYTARNSRGEDEEIPETLFWRFPTQEKVDEFRRKFAEAIAASPAPSG